MTACRPCDCGEAAPGIEALNGLNAMASRFRTRRLNFSWSRRARERRLGARQVAATLRAWPPPSPLAVRWASINPPCSAAPPVDADAATRAIRSRRVPPAGGELCRRRGPVAAAVPARGPPGPAPSLPSSQDRRPSTRQRATHRVRTRLRMPRATAVGDNIPASAVASTGQRINFGRSRSASQGDLSRAASIGGDRECQEPADHVLAR